MKLAILFHFDKHTETLSINTDKVSSHLQQKIQEALNSDKRVSISFDAFQSIKQHQLKKDLKTFNLLLD